MNAVSNSVKVPRKGKAYIDLAAEHMLSSPDTVFRLLTALTRESEVNMMKERFSGS